jgi:hypothetical protein
MDYDEYSYTYKINFFNSIFFLLIEAFLLPPFLSSSSPLILERYLSLDRMRVQSTLVLFYPSLDDWYLDTTALDFAVGTLSYLGAIAFTCTSFFYMADTNLNALTLHCASALLSIRGTSLNCTL